MTETTLVAEEQPAPERDPARWWPLAEETLDVQPAWREYYAGHDAVVALADPVDVVVASGLRGEFDREVESYSPANDWRHRADLDDQEQAARIAVFAGCRPTTTPVPHFRPAEDEAWASESQQASVTDLGRWSRGKSFSDEPDDTRFLDAFALDPEGDEDRAPLPAGEVHHEAGEDR